MFYGELASKCIELVATAKKDAEAELRSGQITQEDYDELEFAEQLDVEFYEDPGEFALKYARFLRGFANGLTDAEWKGVAGRPEI